MTCGLVHASYSLPEWQAVKLTFFAPCSRSVGQTGKKYISAKRLGIGGLVPQHNSRPGDYNNHGHKINVAEIAMVIVIERERWQRKKRGDLWKWKCGFNYWVFYKGLIWMWGDKNSWCVMNSFKISTKTDAWELSMSFLMLTDQKLITQDPFLLTLRLLFI